MIHLRNLSSISKFILTIVLATAYFESVGQTELPSITAQTFSINENPLKGAIIDTVKAIDPLGGALTYKLITGDTAAVSINSASGILSVKDSLQFNAEVRTTLIVGVEVKNLFASAIGSITIEVKNVNEPPIGTPDSISIADNLSNGTIIGFISASDPEFDPITYSLVGEVNGKSTAGFTVDGSLGTLSVGNNTALTGGPFRLIIGLSDGSASSQVILKITVIRENNILPTFQNVTYDVLENSPNGTKLGKLNASDANGDPLSFLLTQGNELGNFSIDTAANLFVVNSTGLDFESVKQYTLGLEISDGFAFVTGTVTINVKNVNEAPTITGYSSFVKENSATGTVITTVEVRDPDQGDSLKVKVLSFEESKFLSINQKYELVVTDPSGLDFEKKSILNVVVKVQDRDKLSALDTITIEVINVDEAPIIQAGNFRVEQTSSNGDLVGKIVAKDPEGKVLTLNILSGNTGDVFTLLSNGEIKVNDATGINSDVTPVYTLEINASDGTLSSTGFFTIKVTTLELDRTALMEFYDNTKGDNWTQKANWGNDPVSNDWEGVSVVDGRVRSLNLSGNNIVGAIPESFSDLTGLTEINLSDNKIDKIPNISNFTALTSLNVSNNKLGFGDIISNMGEHTYTYSPQKTFGILTRDTIPAGDDFTVDVNMSGEGNQYQWFLKDTENKDVTLGNGPYHQVVSIDYAQMGRYYAEITNPLLPDLKIKTETHRVMAYTDIFGNIYSDTSKTGLQAGKIFTYRLKNGPFILEDSADVVNGGYRLSEVLLGDFVLFIRPSESLPDILPTYYKSTDDWINADTLFLREKAEGIDIQMLFNPGEFEEIPENIGFIGGTLYDSTEIITDDGSRIETRRRVKKAGCSLRRRTRGGGGRIGEDSAEYVLVAYVETNDEGIFEFENIPDGEYRINIQYPGVPMDESTVIDFIIGAGEDIEDNSFLLEAIITEEGILVEVVEILSLPRPYIDNIIGFPNPTDGIFTFNYIIKRKITALNAIVYDIGGNIIVNQEIENRYGQHKATIDFSEYKKGIYYLVISDGYRHFVRSQKIIKN